MLYECLTVHVDYNIHHVLPHNMTVLHCIICCMPWNVNDIYLLACMPTHTHTYMIVIKKSTVTLISVMIQYFISFSCTDHQ